MSNIGCYLPGVSLKIWGNFQSVFPAVYLALETGYHEQLSHMLPVTKEITETELNVYYCI